MSAVHLGTWVHDSPEWHAARAGGIGASEIAAVVGLSPYVSAFHLWHQKKGNLPAQNKTDAMDWGHRLEPVVRDWWQERHPEFCDYIVRDGTYAHAERDWQRVNPDGLLHPADGCLGTSPPTALYEGKTSRFGDGFGPTGSDVIPIGHRCQVQWALDVFDLPRAYVAVLIGGNEPREYVIEADADDQATLREAGARFWASLQTDDEPPIDASFSTYEAVRNLHPEIDRDAEIALTPDLWVPFVALRADATEAESELVGVKSKILAAMGTARIATFNNTPVLRRQMSSTGTPYLKEIAS